MCVTGKQISFCLRKTDIEVSIRMLQRLCGASRVCRFVDLQAGHLVVLSLDLIHDVMDDVGRHCEQAMSGFIAGKCGYECFCLGPFDTSLLLRYSCSVSMYVQRFIECLMTVLVQGKTWRISRNGPACIEERGAALRRI